MESLRSQSTELLSVGDYPQECVQTDRARLWWQTQPLVWHHRQSNQFDSFCDFDEEGMPVQQSRPHTNNPKSL